MIGQVRPMLREAEQTSSYYTGSESGFDTCISFTVKDHCYDSSQYPSRLSPASIMYKSHSLVCREASILLFTIETFA